MEPTGREEGKEVRSSGQPFLLQMPKVLSIGLTRSHFYHLGTTWTHQEVEVGQGAVRRLWQGKGENWEQWSVRKFQIQLQGGVSNTWIDWMWVQDRKGIVKKNSKGVG